MYLFSRKLQSINSGDQNMLETLKSKQKWKKSTLFTDIINYISVAIICNELLSDCLFLTSCHLSCRSISRRQMKEFVPPEEKRG